MVYNDKIKEDDTFNFTDISSFEQGKQLTFEIVHSDGNSESIKLNHSYNEQQIEWYRAGSALNTIKRKNA